MGIPTARAGAKARWVGGEAASKVEGTRSRPQSLPLARGRSYHAPMSQRRITDVAFTRDKYGSELLVDVARTSELQGFIADDRTHRLGFYDLILITRGQGWLWLDSSRLRVAPGVVLFTSPHQVRRWQVDDLDGICLFFEEGFLSEFFSDALFLQRLIFFHGPGEPLALALPSARRRWLEERLTHMQRELVPLKKDSVHLLRAGLYEVLITLNRWALEREGLEAVQPERGPAAAFRRAVEANYRTEHKVRDYARRLAVTPGHLNHLAHRHLGANAGSIIRGRIVLEARRLLLHSDRSVARIGSELGFRDRSYFSRFFRRETGITPSAYRHKIREKYHS